MSTQTELDAQEAHLQQQLRIARMKVQLGKARAELWATRLPMLAAWAVWSMALLFFGLLAVAIVRTIFR